MAKTEVVFVIVEGTYRLRVNSRDVVVTAPQAYTLLDVLREKLGLTGSKEGCNKGECGACTIILNGKAVDSCLVLMAQAAGADIITIEGLSREGWVDPIQEAFVAEGAAQCGYCIPGVIVSSKALLMKNLNPTMDEIKVALAGNLCRCTGYIKIFKAVQKASLSYRQEPPSNQR